MDQNKVQQPRMVEVPANIQIPHVCEKARFITLIESALGVKKSTPGKTKAELYKGLINQVSYVSNSSNTDDENLRLMQDRVDMINEYFILLKEMETLDEISN